MQFVGIVDRFKVTFLLYPADLYIWKQHLLPNGCSEQLMEAHVFWTRGDRLQWHHRLAVWGWERRCRVIQPGTRDLWYKFKNVTSRSCHSFGFQHFKCQFFNPVWLNSRCRVMLNSVSVGFKCLQIKYSLYLCLKVRHKAGIFIIQPPFLHDHTRLFFFKSHFHIKLPWRPLKHSTSIEEQDTLYLLPCSQKFATR